MTVMPQPVRDCGIQLELKASPKRETGWAWSWRVFCSRAEDWSGVAETRALALAQGLAKMDELIELYRLRSPEKP